MDGIMLVEDGKEDASSWASCLDTYDTLLQQMEVLFANVVPPVGGRTVQGILMPICTFLMATLVKGHLPRLIDLKQSHPIKWSHSRVSPRHP